MSNSYAILPPQPAAGSVGPALPEDLARAIVEGKVIPDVRSGRPLTVVQPRGRIVEGLREGRVFPAARLTKPEAAGSSPVGCSGKPLAGISMTAAKQFLEAVDPTRSATRVEVVMSLDRVVIPLDNRVLYFRAGPGSVRVPLPLPPCPDPDGW